MPLINFSLRNPFAVVALSIALCILGSAVIPSTPIDILPDFEKPVIVSFFSYPGLPTMDMEKSVSSRVERALTLAGRIEHQESRTVPGASVIKIFFQPGTNPSSAMNDIVNLEASDMFHLPPGIEWPFTLRSEPANMPVVLAAISGEGLSEKELYTIGYYAVRNRMGGLKGVQIPHPFGGKFRQMMVYVDPAKLQAHNISATDVVEAMRKSNLVLAAGTARMGGTDYQIHPRNTLPTTEEIAEIPIAVRDGRPIFIRDVGRVEDDAALQYNIVRVNGKRSVYCPLLREPGENTIAVVDRIREGLAKEIPQMKQRGDIPNETEVTLVSDQSHYIRTAMSNLFRQVGLGALLVAVVVVIFLRRFLPALIIVATIVLAILIGGLGFAFTGQTINVMTLGGIALAIGTVVDAGIVVVEKRDSARPHGQESDGRSPRWDDGSLGRHSCRNRHDASRVLACRILKRHDQILIRAAFTGRDFHDRCVTRTCPNRGSGFLCDVHSREGSIRARLQGIRRPPREIVRWLLERAARHSCFCCDRDRCCHRSHVPAPTGNRQRVVPAG